MNPRRALAALAIASIGSVAFGLGPAGAAPAVEINSGMCHKGLPAWQNPYLAPAIGNGPFVIVNGNFVSTNGQGFLGYMGCSLEFGAPQ